MNQTCGTDQPSSSAFVNNHITGFLIGGLKSCNNFRYLSPNCAHVAGGSQINSGTGAKVCNPTLGSGVGWGIDVEGFKH